MVEPGAAGGAFEDYWERFVAHLEHLGRSPLTIKNYLSDLKAFGQWLKTSGTKRLGLTKVTSKELKQYQEFLLTQQKLKPNSVNRRMGTLKNFYTWLQQTELLDNEPLPHMPALVQEVPVERAAPLSQEEQLRLLEAVEQSQNQRDRAILKLLLHTGVRVGELCQLRWVDLDLKPEQGQLLVRSVKSKQVRRLVLSPDVCAALLELGDQAQAGSQALVFVGQRGGMTSQGVQDVVKKYALRAGLRSVTPHMLRHTHAYRLVEQGVPPDKITTLMGMSAEILLTYYVRLLPVEKAPP